MQKSIFKGEYNKHYRRSSESTHYLLFFRVSSLNKFSIFKLHSIKLSNIEYGSEGFRLGSKYILSSASVNHGISYKEQ